MIKFETEEKHINDPVFGDVGIDQFFIDRHGRFCQKESNAGYVVIADPDGTPFCCSGLNSVEWSTSITQVLPKVTKIIWEK